MKHRHACGPSTACREGTSDLEAVSQGAGTPVGFPQKLQVLLHVCWGGMGRGRLQQHIHLCLLRHRAQALNQGEQA